MDLLPDLEGRDVRAEFVAIRPELGDVFDAVMEISRDDPNGQAAFDEQCHLLEDIAADYGEYVYRLVPPLYAAWRQRHVPMAT